MNIREITWNIRHNYLLIGKIKETVFDFVFCFPNYCLKILFHIHKPSQVFKLYTSRIIRQPVVFNDQYSVMHKQITWRFFHCYWIGYLRYTVNNIVEDLLNVILTSVKFPIHVLVCNMLGKVNIIMLSSIRVQSDH